MLATATPKRNYLYICLKLVYVSRAAFVLNFVIQNFHLLNETEHRRYQFGHYLIRANPSPLCTHRAQPKITAIFQGL